MNNSITMLQQLAFTNDNRFLQTTDTSDCEIVAVSFKEANGSLPHGMIPKTGPFVQRTHRIRAPLPDDGKTLNPLLDFLADILTSVLYTCDPVEMDGNCINLVYDLVKKADYVAARFSGRTNLLSNDTVDLPAHTLEWVNASIDRCAGLTNRGDMLADIASWLNIFARDTKDLNWPSDLVNMAESINELLETYVSEDPYNLLQVRGPIAQVAVAMTSVLSQGDLITMRQMLDLRCHTSRVRPDTISSLEQSMDVPVIYVTDGFIASLLAYVLDIPLLDYSLETIVEPTTCSIIVGSSPSAFTITNIIVDVMVTPLNTRSMDRIDNEVLELTLDAGLPWAYRYAHELQWQQSSVARSRGATVITWDYGNQYLPTPKCLSYLIGEVKKAVAHVNAVGEASAILKQAGTEYPMPKE